MLPCTQTELVTDGSGKLGESYLNVSAPPPLPPGNSPCITSPMTRSLSVRVTGML